MQKGLQTTLFWELRRNLPTLPKPIRGVLYFRHNQTVWALCRLKTSGSSKRVQTRETKRYKKSIDGRIKNSKMRGKTTSESPARPLIYRWLFLSFLTKLPLHECISSLMTARECSSRSNWGSDEKSQKELSFSLQRLWWEMPCLLWGILQASWEHISLGDAMWAQVLRRMSWRVDEGPSQLPHM